MVKESQSNKRKRQERGKEKDDTEKNQVPINLEESSDEVEGSKSAPPTSDPPTHKRRKGKASNVSGSASSARSTSKVNNNMEKFLLMGNNRYYGSQKVLKGGVINEGVLGEPGMVILLEKLRVQGW